MSQVYGQLLDNATTLWAERKGWFPGKWATVALLRQAARDPRFQVEVARVVSTGHMPGEDGEPPNPFPPVPPGPGPEPFPVPTLADLVNLAFNMVLLIYGPALPFGGYWVRAAHAFVMNYLNELFVPRGLAYRPV